MSTDERGRESAHDSTAQTANTLREGCAALVSDGGEVSQTTLVQPTLEPSDPSRVVDGTLKVVPRSEINAVVVVAAVRSHDDRRLAVGVPLSPSGAREFSKEVRSGGRRTVFGSCVGRLVVGGDDDRRERELNSGSVRSITAPPSVAESEVCVRLQATADDADNSVERGSVTVSVPRAGTADELWQASDAVRNAPHRTMR